MQLFVPWQFERKKKQKQIIKGINQGRENVPDWGFLVWGRFGVCAAAPSQRAGAGRGCCLVAEQSSLLGANCSALPFTRGNAREASTAARCHMDTKCSPAARGGLPSSLSSLLPSAPPAVAAQQPHLSRAGQLPGFKRGGQVLRPPLSKALMQPPLLSGSLLSLGPSLCRELKPKAKRHHCGISFCNIPTTLCFCSNKVGGDGQPPSLLPAWSDLSHIAAPR